MLQVDIYDQLYKRRVKSSIETYLGNKCKNLWDLNKYPGYGSSLEVYLWISNMTSNDNLGLNLYIVPNTCHIVIILDWRVRDIRETR